MGELDEFSTGEITSLQKTIFQRARQLQASSERQRQLAINELLDAKQECLKQLNPNVIVSSSDIIDRDFSKTLENRAVQQANYLHKNASQSFEKAKKEADALNSALSPIIPEQKEILSKWSRIDLSSLEISESSVWSNYKPESLEECQRQAIECFSKLIVLGDPEKFGSGGLGRSPLGVIGDVLTGGFGAVIGMIWLLAAGGIPAIVVSAIIALVISVAMNVPFMSVLWTLLGIVLGIGILIGLLGGFTSDEEKEKKKNQRARLQDGGKSYLAYKYLIGKMPKFYSERINLLESQATQTYEQADDLLKKMRASIEDFEHSLLSATEQNQRKMNEINDKNAQEELKLRSEIKTLASLFPVTPAVMDWEHTNWLKDPATLIKVPDQKLRQAPGAIRIGLANYPENIKVFESTPLLIDISECGHIFIVCKKDTQAQADMLLQSIIARLVFSTSVNSAKYIFIDPRASGTFSVYLNLPERMGNYDYSSSDEIQKQIEDLEFHKKQVQGKIGEKSLVEYNQKAILPEMYRFLCITGFPNENRFDRQTYQHLENIIENGNRVGIHLIVQINMDSEEFSRLPDSLLIDQLSNHGAMIIKGDENWELRINSESIAFFPDSAPNYKIFNNLLPRIKTLVSETDLPTVNFSKIIPPFDKWWTRQSRPLLDVQFGYAGEKQLRFRLGSNGVDNFVHALVAGQSGSGKSVFFHTLINNIALNYSPEEVELYLLDFKQGVEFKPYADFRLPHARVIAIESEPEFGLSILNNLWNEHLRRTKLGMQKFEEFDQKLPRIIVIFDEYQMLFGETSSVSRNASLLLNQLARQSRSSGIHLILGSQSKVDEIDATTYEQFTTRILLQASETLAGQILSVDNAYRANELTHAGQIIYNEKKGIGSEKDPVGQVAMVSREEVIQNLQRLNKFSEQKGYKQASPTIVFRGDQPSSFSANKHAMILYGTGQWLTPQQIKQNLGLKDWVTSEQPSLAWLGEAIEIKMHTAAAFRRRSRSNLLLVGSQEETIFGMLSGCMLSLPLFYKPGNAEFLIADLSLKDEEWADTCEHFRDAFSTYKIKVEEKGSAKIIEQLYEILQDRKQAQENGFSENVPSIFLLIAGIQRVPQLKPVISSFGTEPSPLSLQLIEILDTGPELGIHSILWVDNTRNFEKILGRSVLNHISQRVTLHLSESESQFLLDDVAAAGLKGYRALFFDEEAEHPLEKFKPYAMPNSNLDRARALGIFGKCLTTRKQ